MMDIVFLHDGSTFNYREGQPCDDGLYKLVDNTFVYVSNVDLVLKSKIEKKKNTYFKDNYSTLRKSEYDNLNQFDLMYQDSIDGGTRWRDAIESIKLKYPKI